MSAPQTLGALRRWGVALLAAMISCAPQTPDSGRSGDAVPLAIERQARAVACPADTGSAEPFLAAGERETVYLSWLGRAESGERTFYMAKWRGANFDEPRVVARGDSLFANWADTPGLIVIGDERLVAWWLVRQGDGYAYHVRASATPDGGRTWSAPVAPHADASLTEHGFVSAAVEGDGARLLWLDGRAFEGAEAHGHDEAGPGPEMQLRTGWMDARGAVHDEGVVDMRVCDCCQTAAVAVPGGTLAAYRDRTTEEIRDISLARLEAGKWSEPHSALADGWRMPGCPVNGPALDARGEAVALAWFTGAGDTARVLAALSSDGGRRFGPAIRVDEGNPAGRCDVALLPDGSALVTWIESSVDTAHVLLRRITPRGVSTSWPVATVSSSRRSGFPRLLVVDGAALVAWTEVGPPSRVRLARVKIRKDELDVERTARRPLRGREEG